MNQVKKKGRPKGPDRKAVTVRLPLPDEAKLRKEHLKRKKSITWNEFLLQKLIR